MCCIGLLYSASRGSGGEGHAIVCYKASFQVQHPLEIQILIFRISWVLSLALEVGYNLRLRHIYWFQSTAQN